MDPDILDAVFKLKVREEGLEDLAGVKRIYLESDGEISLIRHPKDDDSKKTARPPRR